MLLAWSSSIPSESIYVKICHTEIGTLTDMLHFLSQRHATRLQHARVCCLVFKNLYIGLYFRMDTNGGRKIVFHFAFAGVLRPFGSKKAIVN